MEPQTPPPANETIFDEQDFLASGYDKHLRQARNAIFVVAAIQFLFGLVLGYQGPVEERYITIGIMTFVALIFLGLGLWANKKPYPAILAAIIVYGCLLLLDAIFDPMSLLKGIILKAFIIFYLFRGLKNAKEFQQRKALIPKE
jgi:hypothetical protein